jgi:hypothetical protein
MANISGAPLAVPWRDRMLLAPSIKVSADGQLEFTAETPPGLKAVKRPALRTRYLEIQIWRVRERAASSATRRSCRVATDGRAVRDVCSTRQVVSGASALAAQHPSTE